MNKSNEELQDRIKDKNKAKGGAALGGAARDEILRCKAKLDKSKATDTDMDHASGTESWTCSRCWRGWILTWVCSKRPRSG